MKVIKDYHIDKNKITPQTIYVTKEASIVSVADNGFDFALTAMCNAHEIATDLRTFKIYCTNETIYEDNIRYIGTVSDKHIIEIL